MKCTMPAVLFSALFAFGAHAAPILTFDLVPSGGTIAGNSLGTVGWGYDITSTDPVDWVVLNDSFVTGSLASGTFGAYVDYIALNFIVIDPSSSTGTVPFSAGTTGTGEFDIDSAVPPDTIIPGQIGIDYSVFSQDPNSPTFDPDSFVTDGTVFATAQVDVNAPGTGVPEPKSVIPLSAALLAVVFVVRKRLVRSVPSQHT
jgi:hypothetical protein